MSLFSIKEFKGSVLDNGANFGICRDNSEDNQDAYSLDDDKPLSPIKSIFSRKSTLAEQKLSSSLSLGRLYAEGKGVKQSFEKAMEHWQIAAHHGEVSAYAYLAKAYENGLGVEQSQEKAHFFYQKRFQYYKEKADIGNYNFYLK